MHYLIKIFFLICITTIFVLFGEYLIVKSFIIKNPDNLNNDKIRDNINGNINEKIATIIKNENIEYCIANLVEDNNTTNGKNLIKFFYFKKYI
jgi:hypothetical protein